MEMRTMKTLVHALLRRKKALIMIPVIASLLSVAYAAVLLTQNYNYSLTGLTGPSSLDFGTLTPGASGSKLFTNALNTGSFSTSTPFNFANPDQWLLVFTGLHILVRTQGASPTSVACISLGTGFPCPSGLTNSFTPPGTPTNYDYFAEFTVSSSISTGHVLETTWSG